MLKFIEPCNSIINAKHKANRPGYYDYTSKEIAFDLLPRIDSEADYDIKKAKDQESELQRVILERFDGFTVIYTDGTFQKKR